MIKLFDLIVFSDKWNMSLFEKRKCSDSKALKSYSIIPYTVCSVLQLNMHRADMYPFLLFFLLTWPYGTYEHLLKLNIVFQLWWEVSCWEELKWADRRQCTILIAVFLSLSVFLCWDNVIVVQAWLRLAGRLCPTDSQNHLQAR